MGIPYADVIDRMRHEGRLKNDSAVARVLGVTPQALSNYKKRGEMPTDLVIRFAEIYKLSVDYLLTGNGGAHKPELNPLSEVLSLEPDEAVVIGKSLQVLRGNRYAAAAFRQSVDSFLNLSTQPEAV